MNLVVSSLYITAIVTVTAVPCFFYLTAVTGQLSSHWLFAGRFGLGTPNSVALGVILTLLLAAVATFFPLRMGLRAFRRLEF